MAKQEVVIEVDIQGTAKVESMRTQMRKLREELATLPEGTAEFNRVQRQLGELKDRMDDLGRSVNTVSGAPLERLNNSMSMIGSSILSLDFENALTGVKGMTSAMKDFKFGDLSKGAKSFGGTMFDLGKTLLMNPIFLIASVIAAIILNFDKLVNAGGLVGKVFGFIKEQIDFVIDGITDFLNWTGLIDTEASERAEEAKKRNEEMLADLQKANDAVQKMRDDLARGRMTERQRELADIQKWYDDQLWLARGNSELQLEIAELARIKQAEINDKYNKQEEEKARLAAEKRKKEEESRLAEQIKANQKAAAQISAQIQKDSLAQSQTRLAARFEESKSVIQLSTDEELAEEMKRERIREGEIALANSKYEIAQAAIGGIMDLNDALTSAGILNAEQSFKVGKALQLAQATISAITGTQNAFTTASASPITTAFPGYPFVMAGIAAAAGAANIAKIASMKFNKDGGSPPGVTPPNGGGGGGMGGGSTNAPALDLSFINGQTNQPQPLQTYVLATNVSTAQEAEQKIKDQSRIIK
jgi:hypothetical protein